MPTIQDALARVRRDPESRFAALLAAVFAFAFAFAFGFALGSILGRDDEPEELN